jgi:tetratricopeptide (TPR) repeat protein
LKTKTNTMNLSTLCRTTVFTAALLLTCTIGHAQTATELMQRGDVHDVKFQAAEALRYYLPAEKLEPGNVDLLVRIARQYRHLMSDASTGAEKLKIGAVALDYGKRAARLGPNDSDAQISPAITYGRMLPFQSNKEQVAATPLIKAAADRAIALNPRNDVAWHVLGRWHQVLANMGMMKHLLGGLIYGKLPTTTHEAAIVCFERAIVINPRRPRHFIELGRTYAQMGKSAEARKYIGKGLTMADMEKDDAEVKQRGREDLAKLP